MNTADICSELQALQRRRAATLKCRIRIENALLATVAVFNGYHAGLGEKERKEQYDQARTLVAAIKDGEESPLSALVLNAQLSIDGFQAEIAKLEKAMVKLVKQLPVAEWVNEPEQRGFGLQLLAVVLGETGDLANYANPAKVWKRMGCAPFTSGDRTLMGKTWASMNGKGLSAEEWSQFGYSPRRRSIAYLIGECLVKQNGEGPYRRRYDEAKATAAEKHEDWTKGHCHLHGMLLATKRLLRDLWSEWNHAKVKA